MIYAAGVWRHIEELYTESKYTCSGGGGVQNINVRVPGIIIKYTRVCCIHILLQQRYTGKSDVEPVQSSYAIKQLCILLLQTSLEVVRARVYNNIINRSYCYVQRSVVKH